VCACECARQLERGHVDREEEERVVASLLFAYCVCCRRALCYMLSARRDSTHSALSVIEEQSPGRQINWIRFSSRAELRRHSPLARASLLIRAHTYTFRPYLLHLSRLIERVGVVLCCTAAEFNSLHVKLNINCKV
jgi:hypothetical protein